MPSSCMRTSLSAKSSGELRPATAGDASGRWQARGEAHQLATELAGAGAHIEPVDSRGRGSARGIVSIPGDPGPSGRTSLGGEETLHRAPLQIADRGGYGGFGGQGEPEPNGSP